MRLNSILVALVVLIIVGIVAVAAAALIQSIWLGIIGFATAGTFGAWLSDVVSAELNRRD